MSTPRYDWWSYVKGIIRRYPALKELHDSLMSQQITPVYSPTIGGRAPGRSTEDAVLAGMGKTGMREYYAVASAINITQAQRDGEAKIKLVNLIYWKGTHSLVGATMECHVSERVGREWHRQFIRLVAKEYGLLD